MSKSSAPMLPYSPPGKRRRLLMWLVLVMLLIAGVGMQQNWQLISNWIVFRRMVYSAYSHEQRCMRLPLDKCPALTLTNAVDRGQAIVFTNGKPSDELNDFTAVDGEVQEIHAGLQPEPTSQVIAMHQVVRPDGTKRLVVVETDGNLMLGYVWSAGTPFSPGMPLTKSVFKILLPPHRPFTIGPGVLTVKADAVSLGARFDDSSTTGGRIDFAIGNDDAVTMRPSFGFVPPGVAETWAPAGPPAGWPVTIAPNVTRLPFAGLAIGFESPTVLVVAGQDDCRRIDLIKHDAVSRIDYGGHRVGQAVGAVVSTNGRRAAVLTGADHWFLCDTRENKVISESNATMWGSDLTAPAGHLPMNETDEIGFIPNGVRPNLRGTIPAEDLAPLHDTAATPPSSQRNAVTTPVKQNPFCVVEPSNNGGSVLYFRVTDRLRDIYKVSLVKRYTDLSLSPDNNRLLCVGQNAVGLLDFPPTRQQFAASPNFDIADQFIGCRPALLPGYKWAVVAGKAMGLYLFDLSPSQRVLRIDGVNGVVTDMAVSPDGAMLAVSTRTGLFLIHVTDIESAARSALGK